MYGARQVVETLGATMHGRVAFPQGRTVTHARYPRCISQRQKDSVFIHNGLDGDGDDRPAKEDAQDEMKLEE